MRTAIPTQSLGLKVQTMSDVSALEAYSKSNVLQSTPVAGLSQTWCGPTWQSRKVKRARDQRARGTMEEASIPLGTRQTARQLESVYT